MVIESAFGNVLSNQSLDSSGTAVYENFGALEESFLLIPLSTTHWALVALGMPLKRVQTLLVENVAAGEHYLVFHLELFEADRAYTLSFESIFRQLDNIVPLLARKRHRRS